ncbi:MAG: ATP-binding cassette domain-containing protein, partial [Defluviitaleaceae bacterium]|nr:ATP-binding cassette domain-containing protein [Defluviitaleaceae bacterium]
SGLRGEQLRFYRRKLGLVFQHFNLLMNSTVYDNIAFPLKVAGKPKAYIQSQVNKLLELVGLEEKRNSYPSRLSGGQKQRVGIARALAAEPSIVICDEATSALDPSTTESIMQLIKQINRTLGITFVIITHEMEVIKQVCNRVAILEHGEVIELGTVVDVCAYPKTATAQRFFKIVDTELTNAAYKGALSSGGKLLKCTFVGDTAPDPFMSECIKRFGVTISVLSGNIQEIGETLIGCIVIMITGDEPAVQASMKYLAEHNIPTEVLDIEQA